MQQKKSISNKLFTQILKNDELIILPESIFNNQELSLQKDQKKLLVIKLDNQENQQQLHQKQNKNAQKEIEISHLNKEKNVKQMLERWLRTNKQIPQRDFQDIIQQNPLVVNKQFLSYQIHQAHPEYSQAMYLRIRAVEEATLISNYLDDSVLQSNNGFHNQASSPKNSNFQNSFSKSDRYLGIQKIIEIHEKKQYEVESLFLAANIFDRYLYQIGVKNMHRKQIISLVAVCLLISAKIEEPNCPSFSKMIEILSDDDKKLTSKKQLFDLERKVLILFSFDFNFSNPVQPTERFLRILNYDKNEIVRNMALELCKLSLNDPIFLNFRQTMIAACAVIISINVFEKNNSENFQFFMNCQERHGLTEMNLDIWNNQEVHFLTGYTIKDIQKCLYTFCKYIDENDFSDTIKLFDLKRLLKVKNYEGCMIINSDQIIYKNH